MHIFLVHDSMTHFALFSFIFYSLFIAADDSTAVQWFFRFSVSSHHALSLSLLYFYFFISCVSVILSVVRLQKSQFVANQRNWGLMRIHIMRIVRLRCNAVKWHEMNGSIYLHYTHQLYDHHIHDLTDFDLLVKDGLKLTDEPILHSIVYMWSSC
jgi:hypothetical protein